MTSTRYRQLTKDELLHELEALLAIEQEYRVLLDESSDPIFAFFCDGQYRYVNQAFANGVGRNRSDIIGHKIWDVFPQDEADKRFAVVKWVFENGQTKIIEVRVPRPDGDRYFVTTAKPIFDDSNKVISVICISKDITDRKFMEEKLARLAQYDALTDLPNRSLFSDRLQHAIADAMRHQTHLAVFFVDLDHFKSVNDSLGHSVGDLLLQAAARRLQACVRKSDTVARMGGDEFVVVLPGIEDAHFALALAHKMCQAMSEPFDLNGQQCSIVSSSIGVAIYPEHGMDELELSRNADNAMYQAKSRGRNCVQLFQLA